MPRRVEPTITIDASDAFETEDSFILNFSESGFKIEGANPPDMSIESGWKGIKTFAIDLKMEQELDHISDIRVLGSRLKRCAWDHSLYYTGTQIAWEDKEDVGVAFYRFFNEKFEFDELRIYHSKDGFKTDVHMLDKNNTFAFNKGKCTLLVWDTEGNVIESKIFENNAVFNENLSITVSISGDSYVISENNVKDEDFRLLQMPHNPHSFISCENVDCTVHNHFKENGCDLTIYYWNNDELMTYPLSDEFPIFQSLNQKMSNVYIWKLSHSTKELVISCTFNNVHKMYKIGQENIFTTIDIAHSFVPMRKFSLEFDHIQYFFERFTFNNRTLFKQTRFVPTNNIYLECKDMKKNIRNVYRNAMLITSNNTLFMLDFERNTLFFLQDILVDAKTQRRIFIEKIPSSSGRYFSIIREENNRFVHHIYNLDCFNEENKNISVNKLISSRDSVIACATSRGLVFLKKTLVSHEMQKVFELKWTGDRQLLYEGNVHTFQSVTDDSLVLTSIFDSSIIMKDEDDTWKIESTNDDYCVYSNPYSDRYYIQAMNAKGSYLLVDRETEETKVWEDLDNFKKYLSPNLVLFNNGIYKLGEGCVLDCLCDFKEKSKNDFFYIERMSSSSENELILYDMSMDTIEIKTYTFDHDGLQNIIENNISLVDWLASCKYVNLKDLCIDSSGISKIIPTNEWQI
ncbi:hypothetical protein PCE1_001470 [Barthelona sp. PCE]